MRPGLKVVIPISILCGGGTEVQTLTMAKLLHANGAHVEVVCFNEYYSDVVSAFEGSGITVTLLNHLNRSDKWGLFKKLYRLFRKRRPDVAHVQYLELGLLTLVAAWAARVPVRFATVHQLGNPYGAKPRLMMRMASIFADAIICVSLSVEHSWFGDSALWKGLRCGRRRHWTIYNGTDVEKIAALARENPAAIRQRFCITSGPVVGIVGRICREKGHPVLWEAVCRLLEQFPDLVVVAVGDADVDRAALQLAAELGLADRVVVTNWLPAEDVFRLYGVMDVLVAPSLYEGFGLTAVEGMAAGLPVIASSVGGLVEIIQNRVTGYVHPCNDPIKLSQLIKCVLEDNSLKTKLGDNGLNLARARFGMSEYGNNILSLYQSCS